MRVRALFVLVVCLATSGCPNTDHAASPSLSARPLVPDFRSSIDGDDPERPGVPHGEAPILGFDLELPHEHMYETWSALAAAMTLVRVSDGASVAGSGVRDFLDVDGVEWGAVGYGVTFVPDEPLEGGWHVLRVDFSEARALTRQPPWLFGARVVGDVAYVRYRTDTAAVWVTTRLACDLRAPPSGEVPTEGESCTFAGNFSEELALAATTGASVEVRYDDTLVECVRPFGALFHTHGFGVTCPFPPDDADIEIRLLSDVITDAAGNSPASHRVRFGHLGFAEVQNHETHDVLPDFGIAEADAAAR